MHKFARIAALLVLAIPGILQAHEVYVLPPEMVARALTMPALSIFDVIGEHLGQFFFWTFITLWAIATVFAISVLKPLERTIDPMLSRIRPYAPLIGRLTLGAAIFASGYVGAMFGPELPFKDFLPEADAALRISMMILGICVAAGLFTRAAAAVLIVVFAGMAAHYGTYMLTYANYLGEMLLVLLVGNASHALDRSLHHLYPNVFVRFLRWSERHAFLILRIAFGASLIFASMYAKLIYAQLALDTVTLYGLDTVFPFDAEFLVLGAFAIELLLGLFFVFGIEIRFASLFLLFWLILSLLYFGEAVWPHIILAGTALSIFARGYDRNTLEWGFLHRKHRRPKEPIL